MPSIPFSDILASLIGQETIPPSIAMPLGILSLSSYIKKHSDPGEVAILDYAIKMREISNYENVEDFIRKVAVRDVDFVPDILAFSLIFSTSHRFLDISVDLLKKIWPSALTVTGGIHATNAVTFLLQNPNIDYVVCGEGEIALAEMIKQISASRAIKIKGVHSKLIATAVYENADMIVDLDEISMPDWELLEMTTYVNERGRRREIGNSKGRRAASIMTSQGCPFRCTFCSSHTVHGRKLRYRSVGNVIKEVRLLHEQYGVNLFIPEDDLFTANRVRTLDLLRGMRALNIPDFELQFPNALSVNTLDEQVIDALIDSGMKIINLAIESGSTYVQKHVIKKNCQLKKAVDIVRYLKEQNIIIRCYFILGFPGETREQMRETIEFAKALKADWSVFMIATPLIGSEMFAQFIHRGDIENNLEMWSKAFYSERFFDTDEISASELNELTYRANLECNFFVGEDDIGGRIELYRDVAAKYPFHVIAWYCVMKSLTAMGDFNESARVNSLIKRLIRNDPRAADMFAKYGELMPDLVL